MLKQSRYSSFLTVAMVVLFLAVLSSTARAQSQGDTAPSVAEAARRAREQKKNSGKPSRTLTNEDLPPAARATDDRAAASPGTDPAKGDENATPVSTEGSQAPAAPGNNEKSKQKKAENAAALERAKKDLAQAEGELDVMQRKAALDSESYYSKADFASDKDGKANLDAETQQVSDKKQEVDRLKARVIELQALVGEPAAPANDKNNPQR